MSEASTNTTLKPPGITPERADEMFDELEPALNEWLRSALYNYKESREKVWMHAAWQVLAAANLIADDHDWSGTVLTNTAYLAGLGALCSRFTSVRTGERYNAEWESLEFQFDWDELAVDDIVDDIAVGRWAEDRGLECHTWPETASRLMADAMETNYHAVLTALADAWGLATLFAGLWCGIESDSAQPPTADETWTVVNTDVSGDKLATYEWLTHEVDH